MHGLMLIEGTRRPTDLEAAKAAFDRACEISEDKNGEACSRSKELKIGLTKEENQPLANSGNSGKG
jgi:hypothetical protein